MEKFKTIDDVREYLARLEKWFARTIVEGEHPTLHFESIGREKAIFEDEVRIC
jgi:hypothetical protein